MKINEIIVKERIRKDIGDLTPLMQSMAKHGLMSPIVVNHKNILIAGERRLRAAQQLGWDEIDVRILDVTTNAQMLEIELDENITRKEFEVSELTQGIKKHQESLTKNIFYKMYYFLRDLYKKIFKKDT